MIKQVDLTITSVTGNVWYIVYHKGKLIGKPRFVDASSSAYLNTTDLSKNKIATVEEFATEEAAHQRIIDLNLSE